MDKLFLQKLLLELAFKRGPTKSFCPSEVIQNKKVDNWRSQMNMVREAANDLIRQGQLVCLQKGKVVNLNSARGPVRLRCPDN